VRKIGQYKDQNNMAILQLDRFKEILRTRTETGLHNQLTPDFILRLYSLIHEESISQQDKQMTKPELRASSKIEKH
ncbi:MAG: chorismate mutase, partial [Bacteroidetes bacterium]|nr:chorismate mutase [Bacteroidota bacterium]